MESLSQTLVSKWNSPSHPCLNVAPKSGVRASTLWINIAFFQIKVFSRFHYVLLCNLQLVYGSGNGYIHDYITRRNKTERKLLLETAHWKMGSGELTTMINTPEGSNTFAPDCRSVFKTLHQGHRSWIAPSIRWSCYMISQKSQYN